MKPFLIVTGAVIVVLATVLTIVYSLSGNALPSLPVAMATSAGSVPSIASVSASTPTPTPSSASEVESKITSEKNTVKSRPAIKMGVYYFPGWKSNTPGTSSDMPWNPIKKFPERQPKLGWYDEGDQDVMAAQVATMAANGLSYISFDWYWGPDNHVYLGHAINAFLKLKNKHGLQFSLLWANHDEAPVSMSNFDRMIDYWVTRYFLSPDYLKVDGRPVVTVFSAYGLEIHAVKLGVTVAQLLERANERAKEEGLPGIYFVAGAPSDDPVFKTYALKGSGYSAVST